MGHLQGTVCPDGRTMSAATGTLLGRLVYQPLLMRVPDSNISIDVVERLCINRSTCVVSLLAPILLAAVNVL
jgi:hypothetical protein